MISNNPEIAQKVPKNQGTAKRIPQNPGAPQKVPTIMAHLCITTYASPPTPPPPPPPPPPSWNFNSSAGQNDNDILGVPKMCPISKLNFEAVNISMRKMLVSPDYREMYRPFGT